MIELRNLILLTQTNAWSNAIRRQNWPFRTTWALDIDDLIAEAALRPGSMAIVEIPDSKIAKFCREFAKLNNSPYDLGLLAVGSHQLHGWEFAIRAVGFSDIFWSTSQVKRIEDLAVRHFQNNPLANRTLEERFRIDLPWKPVTTTSPYVE